MPTGTNLLDATIEALPLDAAGRVPGPGSDNLWLAEGSSWAEHHDRVEAVAQQFR